MPSITEAVTFVTNPSRSLDELQIACQQAHLDSGGTVEELRSRLMDFLAFFSEHDDIVCLNPEFPGEAPSSETNQT